MGEYISVDGVDGYPKLGTCEDLYYCRYTDLRDWVRDGRAHRVDGNLEPGDYLDGSFRFRFPFPDEDGEEAVRLAVYHPNYDRGVGFAVPEDMVPADVAHFSQFYWARPRDVEGWGGGVQFSHPCPQGPDYTGNLPVEGRYLSVVQQRPLDGRLWVVVRCGYCAAMWRLDEGEAVRLAEHITRTRPDQAELARRIVAGYAEGVLDA